MRSIRIAFFRALKGYRSSLLKLHFVLERRTAEFVTV